ncbi:OLC1v1024579C1 [Oldenlandia corymbosa var. corymbosa]|uniref:OLC1v1024579C1 n=1 Tax=Oldenlandia corymbosa var. corymbosa TaxID=529605 RepID=A0AAV1C334_OLDCO|nr:OLC1v1024579C1 [Oldenlandia corymbosa var. corymbosa]
MASCGEFRCLDFPSGAIIAARSPTKSYASITFGREKPRAVGSRAIRRRKIPEAGLICWALNSFLSSPIRLCFVGLDRGTCWGSTLTHSGGPTVHSTWAYLISPSGPFILL